MSEERSLLDDYIPGDRVGVFHYKDAPTESLPYRQVPYLIGYGVYVGREEVIVENSPLLEEEGIMTGEEWTEIFAALGGSPKLVLDSGEIMFGYECFFGKEKDIREMFLREEGEHAD